MAGRVRAGTEADLLWWLPALDPTTMGWQRRHFYLGDQAEKNFDRNGNGGPTAWWNGRIVGGWLAGDVVRILYGSPLARNTSGQVRSTPAS